MENEIKVGEYVRTDDGIIAKVLEIKNRDCDVLNYYCLDNDMGTFKTSIVKNSENLIDLVEKGDYINENKVQEVQNGYIMVGSALNSFQLWERDIRTIVTKEMMKSISYKVERK